MSDALSELHALGTIHTPFKQKFAIPRQPNLARAKGEIVLAERYQTATAFKGLETYSHLWLLFYFHKTVQRGWKPLVKAPRLGGNETLGVFASRSTHRPNSIGMSVVENGGVISKKGQTVLTVYGVDLVDGTPIVDIKPYIKYADSVPEATDHLEQFAPIPHREVVLTKAVRAQISEIEKQGFEDFSELLIAVLRQDPRPAYRHNDANDPKQYKVAIYENDVSWQVQRGKIHVLAIAPFQPEG